MSNSREQHQPQQGPTNRADSDPSLAALLRALAAAEPEPLSCAECRAELPALYHLQAEGAPLDDTLRPVLAHLGGCPDCTAEYTALEAVLAELAEGSLPELAATPTFDLSFLETSEATSPTPAPPGRSTLAPQPSLWQRASGTRAWQLVSDLQVRLRTGGTAAGTAVAAAFGTLPGTLTPMPLNGSAAALRTDAPPTGVEWHPEVLVLPAPDADISIHLAVGPVIADNAVVMVKLLAVPSTQPIANTHITLRNAQRQLLLGLVTKPDGTAVFEQLPRGRYLIQVRHDNHLWEIPLVIVAGSPPV